LEHQAQITKLVEVASTNPELKSMLEQHNMDVEKMKTDLDKTTNEIKDLYDTPKLPPVTVTNPIDRKLIELDKKTQVTQS
jgi:uncharacterized coiled-coil protein SlyX